ncbi:MAG TPA: response regulator [Coleofasciculaceae cyanobacterium]
MLNPSFVRSIDPPISTHTVETPAKFIKHVRACSQEQFTGALDLELLETQSSNWNLSFRMGRLIWATSEVHPVRRWCRQLTQHCPTLVEANSGQSKLPNYWNYESLAELVRQKKLPQAQMAAVVAGNIAEILFDILQLWHQRRPASSVKLSYRNIPEELVASTPVLIQVGHVWQQVEQAWRIWQQSGLAHWSPNLAPVILDAEELRRQTSLLAYHNLTTLVNGDRSLRDLGVHLKQNPLSLTLSILPYIQQGAMGLVEVKDLSCSPRPADATRTAAPVAPQQTHSVRPLVAYIDDSRFDNLAMNRILAQAGYRFINVRDPVQALPILLEQKPDLIFLDLLMPVTNGYEVCAQIRRISAFKDTPIIIVTASDGIVDRVRAKLIGSTGFISKPIEPEKVRPILQQYLPIRSPARSPQPTTAWSLA